MSSSEMAFDSYCRLALIGSNRRVQYAFRGGISISTRTDGKSVATTVMEARKWTLHTTDKLTASFFHRLPAQLTVTVPISIRNRSKSLPGHSAFIGHRNRWRGGAIHVAF